MLRSTFTLSINLTLIIQNKNLNSKLCLLFVLKYFMKQSVNTSKAVRELLDLSYSCGSQIDPCRISRFEHSSLAVALIRSTRARAIRTYQSRNGRAWFPWSLILEVIDLLFSREPDRRNKSPYLPNLNTHKAPYRTQLQAVPCLLQPLNVAPCPYSSLQTNHLEPVA